jgi:hypothetical protein
MNNLCDGLGRAYEWSCLENDDMSFSQPPLISRIELRASPIFDVGHGRIFGNLGIYFPEIMTGEGIRTGDPLAHSLNEVLVR